MMFVSLFVVCLFVCPMENSCHELDGYCRLFMVFSSFVWYGLFSSYISQVYLYFSGGRHAHASVHIMCPYPVKYAKGIVLFMSRTVRTTQNTYQGHWTLYQRLIFLLGNSSCLYAINESIFFSLFLSIFVCD